MEYWISSLNVMGVLSTWAPAAKLRNFSFSKIHNALTHVVFCSVFLVVVCSEGGPREYWQIGKPSHKI